MSELNLKNLSFTSADALDFLEENGELKRIQKDAKAASYRGNTITRYHLQDVVDRIDTILDPK